MARTPLAWNNLTHDRIRFGLFVLGITFAVVLMFVQLGFRNALLDSNTILFDHVRADLIMVAPNRQTLAMRDSFPNRRLVQARSVPGVRSVHPLYLENAVAFIRDAEPNPAARGPARAVRVIGIDPADRLLDLPELDPAVPGNRAGALREGGATLFDRRTRPDQQTAGRTMYGPLAEGISTELNGKRIQFIGSFELGPDFTADGSLIMSSDTFLDILRRPYTSGSPTASVDFGLIRLAPGADLKAVQKGVREAVSTGERDPDVEVFTIDEMRDREQRFWKNNTPIGFAFGFGLFMGFAVGLVICYQILSGDVSDHLAEYATLKAMGYRNRDLMLVVLEESVILASVGFVIGWLVSWGAYEFLTTLTGLPLRMTLERAAWMFCVTLVMCAFSAFIALVGLFRADPAEVFG